uniref:Exodeoxyribonuclease 7 large subunit n=1 Tax=Schlesneria paludicola TaxID=360056 RepID=A0A7C4QPB4_9PLAN
MASSAQSPEPPHVLTVSELTALLRGVVEQCFPHVWVAGEVSNLTRAASGHLYFTLKDADAQLRTVMWRSAAQRLRFEVHDGLAVVANGPIEVYPPRGQYQLIAERLTPQGMGTLELALRQLQQKLAAEGLFAPERKRPLPMFPRQIALVTSPQGAAVRDIIQVLARRWRQADVLVIPVAVQGEGAAEQIAQALHDVGRLPRVDVVICGRGGGSLEDLWAFNTEVVARAIAACAVPVVSAVGHEIDVTIADLVADRRALTPSEAAELVVPDQAELRGGLEQLRRRMRSALRRRVEAARWQLDGLASRRCFTRPLDRLHELATATDELADKLQRGIRQRLDAERAGLAALAGRLEALSPLHVLSRGYSVTYRVADGSLVRDAAVLQPGDRLTTRFARGEAVSLVERVHTPPNPADRAPAHGRE